MPIRVLLLCCRENACNILGCLVGQPDITVDYCRGIEDFRTKLEDESYDLIVVDELKGSKRGRAFIHDVHDDQPSATIVLIRSPDAIAARKGLHGTSWCVMLNYPVPPCEIQREIDKFRELRKSGGKGESTRITTPEFPPFMVGEHPLMLTLKDTLLKAASTDLPILICSEPGTGKELAANVVHYLSPRRQRCFVKVLCSTYSEYALARRLFGTCPGAFGGSLPPEQGYLDIANRGTLLLDTVDHLGSETQAKIQRVLEERTFERIGGTEAVTCDVRLVVSTNQVLRALVQDSRFREDLYYRLSVMTTEIPPLRNRKSDIPLLAEHFIQKHSILQHYPGLTAKVSFIDALQHYDWHGNVRELENVIERSIVLGGGKDLSLEHLPEYVRKHEEAAPLRPVPIREYPAAFKIARRQFEKEFLTVALEKHRANISHTAGAIGITRRNLQLKIKQLNIEVGPLKKGDSPGEVSA